MVVKIGRDLCKALILCEKNQIVHRDIKPENIFVSRYGDFKLGDFGIAKNIEKTIGGTKIGTYKYMAPEVYNNKPYSFSVDLYSLGLVMYWMLNAKRMPFMPLPPEKIKASDGEESRYRRLSGEKIPEPMNGSDGLKKIILKACEYNREDRFASAEEMLVALNDLVFGKDSGENISSETDGDEDPENTLPPPGVDELVDLPLESEKPTLEPEVKKNVFEKGEYIKLGTFYDDTSKEEVSLEWKVLDVADGKALLFLDEAVPGCKIFSKGFVVNSFVF